jgi:hypothetical protein
MKCCHFETKDDGCEGTTREEEEEEEEEEVEEAEEAEEAGVDESGGKSLVAEYTLHGPASCA